ncbi:hypothetical protein QJQ45_027759 [Haematococcus lacustris]|nr:hypothetical protein QJQ45_027759 [Haematococcus lacustris]
MGNGQTRLEHKMELGFSAVDKKISAVEHKISAVEHKVDLVQLEVHLLKEQAGKLEARLDWVEAQSTARFDKLVDKLDAYTDTLNQIKGLSITVGAMSAVNVGAAAMKAWESIQTAGKAAEATRNAAATVDKAIQELDNFLNSAWSSAMVRHANSILRTTKTVTVPGESTVTYLADRDSRRAFWSVTAAEQFPILAKAAVRLLSVHVSTAAAERNWSVWTSIYRNALRNKLSVEQAEKLVYVKANAKYETDMLAPPKDIRINIFEPGARGGRGEFNWENVKNGPDAEFYLGHSVKALTGRWQKNRDVYWYTRDKAQQQSLQDEVQAVKQREQQLMMEALGLRPKSEQVVHKQMTAEELAVALQRNAQHQEADAAGAGPDKADVSAADRVKGLGFMPGAAAGVAGSGEPTHARLEGVGVPGNSTAHPQALGGGGGGGLPGPPPMAPGQAGPTLQAMMSMGVALSKQQIKELAKHDKSAAKQAKKEAKKARKAAKHAKKHSKKHKKRAADSGSDSGSSSSAGSDSDAQPPPKLARHTGPAAAPRSHQAGPGCSPPHPSDRRGARGPERSPPPDSSSRRAHAAHNSQQERGTEERQRQERPGLPDHRQGARNHSRSPPARQGQHQRREDSPDRPATASRGAFRDCEGAHEREEWRSSRRGVQEEHAEGRVGGQQEPHGLHSRERDRSREGDRGRSMKHNRGYGRGGGEGGSLGHDTGQEGRQGHKGRASQLGEGQHREAYAEGRRADAERSSPGNKGRHGHSSGEARRHHRERHDTP